MIKQKFKRFEGWLISIKYTLSILIASEMSSSKRWCVYQAKGCFNFRPHAFRLAFRIALKLIEKP
jgi:hypothetical protein